MSRGIFRAKIYKAEKAKLLLLRRIDFRAELLAVNTGDNNAEKFEFFSRHRRCLHVCRIIGKCQGRLQGKLQFQIWPSASPQSFCNDGAWISFEP